jgi:hypothetical protein
VVPLGDGVLKDIGEALPSYRLVQASQGLALGWLVMAAWTLVILLLAGRAYGRDTARV